MKNNTNGKFKAISSAIGAISTNLKKTGNKILSKFVKTQTTEEVVDTDMDTDIDATNNISSNNTNEYIPLDNNITADIVKQTNFSNDEDILLNETNFMAEQDDVETKNDNQANASSQSDIISVLLSNGTIVKSQLNAAKIQADNTGMSVLQCLINMDFVNEQQINTYLYGRDIDEEKQISILDINPKPELISRVPKMFAIESKVIPLYTDNDGKIVVASANPYDIILMDKVSTLLGNVPIKLVKYPQSELLQAINKIYQSDLIDDFSEQMTVDSSFGLDAYGESNIVESDVVKFVNLIIEDAIRLKASDIHIEPEETYVRVRFRIDGVLIQKTIIHKNYWSAICVRIKVLAGMNIAESRRPQDAAITMNIFDRDIDFRVSSIPTIYGENFVLRVLDKTRSLTSLSALGYSKHNLKLIDLALKKPEGIVIATGPTGSGKTTTLYSIMKKINAIEKNIMTLEDPVEYRLPLVRQSEMNERAGLTFASGLRSLLRQDPDIILLGEIRDTETAQNAVRASITGHQVFSTLHTNCAIAAINRLIDMEIPAYMLAGSLNAVVSQRLVRKLCPYCKKKTQLDDVAKKALNLNTDQDYCIYSPTGCQKCNNIGYKGRLAVSEVLFVNEKINMIIAENPTLKQATEVAIENGFIPIADDCIASVINGSTSWSEVCRVVDMTKYIDRLEKMDCKLV
ncbi:MAG: type II/IV secretion system protein [Rickettsiales bacterium]|nr:type II/IV secretion system protein [Rickettsiales bacterium]